MFFVKQNQIWCYCKNFVRQKPKNGVNFKFAVNDWNKTTFWCDVYTQK